MNRFEKLAVLSGQAVKPPTPQSQERRYQQSDSGSDEYITSGRGASSGAAAAATKSVGLTEELGSSVSQPSKELIQYDLEPGELAPEGESFVPWAALKKYPYMYIGVANKQKVCEDFFDGGKIMDEPWDFFYIYRGPTDLNLQPILLVPTRQVTAFLDRINNALSINLSVPSGGANGSFQATFANDGNPQPRYLGFSINSKMAESLRNNVPPHYYKLDGEPGAVGSPSDRSLAAFRVKIELMTQAAKGKKTANKEKQKRERIEKQQAWHHTIKRVQRYLGLREANSVREAKIKTNTQVSGQGWDAFDDAVKAALAKLPPSAVFDAGKPALYQREGSVVFVCVDVEAYERNARQVTEIGVATLDTSDLASLPPGEGGAEWMKKIRARHFRISEHAHLNNSEFVHGCADKFEFGTSEFVSLKDAPQLIASCFKHPFSGPEVTDVDEDHPKRSIILVGHDVGADINFMQSIGYDVTNLPNLLEQADTAVMWRYLKRELNPRNLASILAELGIIGWNLHNAGNDAAYTLQAMVGIAVKHIDDKQKKREVKEKEKRDRITESVKEATEAAVEKEEGWSSGGENSDGGAPIPIASQPKVKKSQSERRNQNAGPWTAAPPSATSTTTNNSSWTSVSQRGPWVPSATSQWGQGTARNGRAGGQWRSGSAPSPAPALTAASPVVAKQTEILGALMKNTSISREPVGTAAGELDTSRWTAPKPKTPR
ncbi:hypothetical protein LZ554_006161 [Drepanopeziza brunnea f. sp. 'monogermtubi']|nr:hypothetical protein LZ554_006161 [Drepanopeziza brunnea f. sp. 'monogermtubi']